MTRKIIIAVGFTGTLVMASMALVSCCRFLNAGMKGSTGILLFIIAWVWTWIWVQMVKK